MDVFRQWLRGHLNSLDKIQLCSVNSDGVLLVRAWSGTRTYIHMVETPPRMRDIKATLQFATPNGAAVLFILSGKLAPLHVDLVQPPDWMNTIHTLTGDRLYTYQVDGNRVQVNELHLGAAGRDERRQVHIRANIEIKHLHFFRIWVKSNPLKGDWLVANFGAHTFWKEADYVTERATYSYRPPQPPQEPPRPQQQPPASAPRPDQNRYRANTVPPASQPEGQRPPPPPPPPRPRTKLDVCYETLELRSGASCEDVKAAFRRLARKLHPDVSTLPKSEAEARFKAVNEAYTYIKSSMDC